MNWKLWSVFLCGVVGILGLPYLVAYNLRLGDFATSPQTVELPMGGSVLIAGGRARLWFVGGDTGSAVEIGCKNEQRAFDSSLHPTDTACGVRVRFIDSTKRQIEGEKYIRGRFEVTWVK
jgi:hypothetical protein